MAIVITEHTTASAPTLNGLAGSLITVLDFALVTRGGWEKVYSGTNKAVYRSLTGNRRFLRVDDSFGNYAGFVFYETMTDINTGTGLSPASGMCYAGKSQDTGSTARPWFILVNGPIFHLFTASDGTLPKTYGANYNALCTFGDFVSYKNGDAYNTVLSAGGTANYNQSATDTRTLGYNLSGNVSGLYVQRAVSQTGPSINANRFSDYVGSNCGGFFGDKGTSLPSPADGNLHVARVYLSDGAAGNVVRGHIQGLWNPLHPRPFSHGDTFTGSGDLDGRTFRVFVVGNEVTGRVFVETSDTWD